MKSIDINTTLIDGYLQLLNNLSANNKLDLISNRRLIEYGPGEGVALVGSRRSEYLAVVPPEVADCVQEMRERRSVVEATAF